MEPDWQIDWNEVRKFKLWEYDLIPAYYKGILFLTDRKSGKKLISGQINSNDDIEPALRCMLMQLKLKRS